MRVFRVLQILLVLALIGYLLVLHNVNPQTVILPFLISLPTSWAVGSTLLVGFAVGWLSGSGSVWRLTRENHALRQQLIKVGGAPEAHTEAHIIPETVPPATTPPAREARRRHAPAAGTDLGPVEPPEVDVIPPEEAAPSRMGRRWGQPKRGRGSAPGDADEEL